MQAQVEPSLIRARKAGRERKGLEAIFTSQSHVRNKEVLTGAVGVVAGLFLSLLAAFPTEVYLAIGAWGQPIYSQLTFGSIGLLLLICGVGTVMFALANHETRLKNSIASSTDDHSEHISERGVEDLSEGRRMFDQSSKLGIVAFIQGLVLAALYAGLVQEYDSNLTLQIWVRSSLPIAQSILNWEGLVILSVSLGLLLVQFLPGRFLSE